MSEVIHTHVEELLGAYALDAVEADEAADIEAHLATCPRCRAELNEHREVVGLFAYTGQNAPAGLWDRITAGMQEPPPQLRLDRIRASMVSPETAPDQPAASVIPIGRRSLRSRRSPGYRAFVALASAAAVVVAVLGVVLAHAQGRADRPSAVATMADVRTALDQKGSRKVVMASPAGGGASLDAVVTPSGVSYLYDSNLTPLPTDRTYQIWGVVGGERISYGLLGTRPAPVVRFEAGPGIDALAVTAEVASGVVTSHNPTVVKGAVSPPL